MNLKEQLEKEFEGMIYQSEGQAPLMVVEASEVDFEQFFEPLIEVQDWYGIKERHRARQFNELKILLKNNLTDLRVFKFGRVEIDVYIVGRDYTGGLVAIRTMKVET